jgi:colanic acid/amylovoran biosynthesis glycosyltransferase
VHAVRAFLEALPACPNMTLTFVGREREGRQGPGVEDVRRMVSSTPAAGKVFFIEGVEFARLHKFMRDYQVFIHPSCYSQSRDCEGGAPIVLLDAQATGMPVIATRHCDIPDEVVDGATGLLSAEGDVCGLTSSIQRFYNMDTAEYDRFATAAREHVMRRHDAEPCAAALEKVYGEVIEGRRERCMRQRGPMGAARFREGVPGSGG